MTNAARHLAARARETPDAPAVIEPDGRRWRTTTCAELDARADAIAHGLADLGLAAGDRCAVLVRPGRDLVATVFALFRIGAAPVIADPGLGLAALARAIGRVGPRALVGVPAAHLLRARLPSASIAVAAGPRWLPGIPTLDGIARPSRGRFPVREGDPGAEAAVLFTSGSTGPAKGVVYAHEHFEAQIGALRALYRFEEGEVDLACFPLFALFAPALGIACAFPRIDAAAPGRSDPAEILRCARECGATTTFGSPAIWRRVVPWAIERGERLPGLRRALVAGAPVPPALVEGLQRLLPAGAEVHAPYGQTEALPLASISGSEILARRERIEGGFGSCVGRPAPGVEIAIAPVRDEPIERWSADLRLPPGALGEICARGPAVTRGYADDPEASAAARIRDEAGDWRRTGDLGYLDGEGLLWFCGRTSHRLETALGTVPPVPAEILAGTHPRVARAALVGLGPRGSEDPALVVEPVPGAMPRGARERESFAEELDLLLARRRPDAPPPGPGPLRTVLFRDALPVDARHNAKLRSEELKAWAEQRAG